MGVRQPVVRLPGVAHRSGRLLVGSVEPSGDELDVTQQVTNRGGEGGCSLRLVERLLAEFAAAADRLRPAEAEQRPRPPASGGERVHERLQQAARQRVLAGELMELRGRDEAIGALVRRIRRRELRGQPGQLRGGGGRAAPGCVLGGAVEGGGDARVGTLCCKREVARALLGIGDDRREPAVRLSAHGPVRPGARHRREQRVHEADAATRDVDHLGVDGRAEHLPRVSSERVSEQVDRTIAPERRQAQGIERRGRQEREPTDDELPERGGNREGLARRDRVGVAVECPPELEREERVPARGVDDLEERRPSQLESEPPPSSACTACTSSPPSRRRVRRSTSNVGPNASERPSVSGRRRRARPRTRSGAAGARTRAPRATRCRASARRRGRRARAARARAP